MIKTLVISAALLAGTISFAFADMGALQTGRSVGEHHVDHHPMHHYRTLHRHHRHHGVANGTGYHGRGTATGGPAGGLPNHN